MEEEDIMDGFQGLTPKFFTKLLISSDPDVTVDAIHVSNGSGRGDNYTSQLYRIRAEGISSTKIKWTKSFICKILPVNRAQREAFKSESLFKNEVAFYTHTLPALTKFQTTQGCSIFNEVPKVYLAKPNIIVLEDLKEDGYVMIDRKKSLDTDHCREILKTLGHLHGVSLAMKSMVPNVFAQEITGRITECLFREENEEWYSCYYQKVGENALKMLEESLDGKSDSAKYLHRFSKFTSDGFFKRMISQVKAVEPFAVLCHGDCWTNNFLFRYNDSGSIISLRMLDFQFARYGSPALDLVYLLFSCMSRDVRSTQLAHLLLTYSTSLQQTLTGLSCPSSVFTQSPLLDVIKSEVDRCSSIGLGLAIEMIPICTCDPDQAPDLYEQDQQDNKQIEERARDTSQSSTETCRVRITELIVELVDRGVI